MWFFEIYIKDWVVLPNDSGLKESNTWASVSFCLKTLTKSKHSTPSRENGSAERYFCLIKGRYNVETRHFLIFIDNK